MNDLQYDSCCVSGKYLNTRVSSKTYCRLRLFKIGTWSYMKTSTSTNRSEKKAFVRGKSPRKKYPPVEGAPGGCS